jgi:hypothetical protein
MVLRHVRGLGVLGPLHCAVIDGQLGHDRAQQRRLADAVRADDCHAFAGLDVQCHIAEDFVLAKALAELVEAHGEPIELLVLLEADVRTLTARRLDLRQLDLLDLPFPRRGLTRLRGIRRKAANELL